MQAKLIDNTMKELPEVGKSRLAEYKATRKKVEAKAERRTRKELGMPEGILMKEFDDYKEQYRSLYFRFTNRSDMDKLHQSIDKLFNVFSPNALNVKKSQCNKEIRSVIPDDEWNKYYVIEAPKGHEHKILLNRKLVTMPDLSC